MPTRFDLDTSVNASNFNRTFKNTLEMRELRLPARSAARQMRVIRRVEEISKVEGTNRRLYRFLGRYDPRRRARPAGGVKAICLRGSILIHLSMPVILTGPSRILSKCGNCAYLLGPQRAR